MANTISLSADAPFPERREGDRREVRGDAAAAEVPAAILPTLRGHADLRKLDRKLFPQLAEEMRAKIIEVVCSTGGHLGSNFGVVEQMIAMHYVFDFESDTLVMDVGHQCYPHKLLTGRFAQFASLRTKNGLSGYPHPAESKSDVMRSGHAGTAISMGLGIAVANALNDQKHHVVCQVGDAGLGCGVALEALNYAGHINTNILVVLNDNEMSISTTVGALASYLNRLRAAPIYRTAKERFHALLRSVPFGEKIDKNLVDMVDAVKAAIAPGHLFEELGFRYYGPIDGHDTELMIDQLEALKDVGGVKLLHLITKKGKGLEPTGKDTRWLHAVSPGTQLPGFATADGVPTKVEIAQSKARVSFTKAFGDAMIQLAERDPKIVAITAAMPEGTGLVDFAKKFPTRFHDTGITEQHAVAFAGGLAKAGMKPVTAIYSTFLQRGYDQVFHEAVLQDLPVVFCMDRGGLVGEDGPSHHGIYDIAYLRTFPSMVICSPRDATELAAMLELGVNQSHPFALRYPRGNTVEHELASTPIEVGKGEVLKDGRDVTLVGYGPMVYDLLDAARKLAAKGIDAAVINARFVKPLDFELLLQFASKTRLMVTLEEHQVMGGFGSAVLEAFALDPRGSACIGRVVPIGIPDRLVEHQSRGQCLADAGLTTDDVVATVLRRLRD